MYERSPLWLEADASRLAGAATGGSAAPSGTRVEVPALNQIEQLRFLRAIASAVEVRRRNQMFRWLESEFQTVLPHRLLVCMLVDAEGNALMIDRFSSAPVPSEVLQEICSESSGLIGDLGRTWFNSGARPLVLVPSGDRYAPFSSELGRLGLRACAVHGVLDHNQTTGSRFFFFGVPTDRPTHISYLLELLTPYLHTALIRVSASDQEIGETGVPGVLTEREIGIMQLIQIGKNNVEIAEALEISPLTVKNHVQRILRKLGANNRAQALGKAIALKILGSPKSRVR